MQTQLSEFMENDHRRLDALLNASDRGASVEMEPFDSFREGILRHIGMEEKILLPEVMKRPGAPRALVEKLRLDHGAIANLLFPPPTPEIIRALRAILTPHNRLEEQSGGLYAACDSLPVSDTPALLERLRSSPEVPLRPYSQRPQALEAAKRAMRRAGFDWDECTRRPPHAGGSTRTA